MASGFRRDISTASETHSAGIRQQYPSDLRVDYDFLQIFTAIPPLMFLVVSSFASKLLNWKPRGIATVPHGQGLVPAIRGVPDFRNADRR